MRLRRYLLIAVTLALTAGFAPPAFADAVGEQRVLVIPVVHNAATPCPQPYVPCPDTSINVRPRENTAQWADILRQIDVTYRIASFGQTSFRFRVLTNPNRADGWWPAPHTPQEYQQHGNFVAGGIVPDVAQNVVREAIREGAISRSVVLENDRLVVIDNSNAWAGQASGAFVHSFDLGGGTTWRTTAAVVAQTASPGSAVQVIGHELGHELGAPDYYSSPCLEACNCRTFDPGGVRQTPLAYPDTTSDCVGGWDLFAFNYLGLRFSAETKLWLGWIREGSSLLRYVRPDRGESFTLDPIERPLPGARPMVLRLLDLPAQVGRSVSRVLGGATPYRGLQVECRRQVFGGAVAPPSEGVLVTWIDEAAGYPQYVVRRNRAMGWADAYLQPGQSYVNRTLGVTLTYTGARSDGGCDVSVDPQARTRVDVSSIVPSGRLLSTRYSSGAIFGASGAGVGRGLAFGPYEGGRREAATFAWQNLGARRSRPGRAVVYASEPYAAQAGCGAQRELGRRIGVARLMATGPGKTRTARVRFMPRGRGSIGLDVRLRVRGDRYHGNDVVHGAAAFQTLRGTAPRTTRVRLHVPRDCESAVTFDVSPIGAPDGWHVELARGPLTLAPGTTRTARIRVRAPAGAAGSRATIPVSIVATEATHTDHPGEVAALENGPDAEAVGGLDIVARVARRGGGLPRFRVARPAVLDRGLPADPKPQFPAPGPAPSSVRVGCDPSVVLGKSVGITGQVTPARSVKLRLSYTDPKGGVTTSDVQSSTTGAFGDVFKPTREGRWTVRATLGSPPVTSPPCAFDVTAP